MRTLPVLLVVNSRREDIKNSGRATTGLVISHSSKCRIQIYVRKSTRALYAKNTRLNGCAARNAPLGLLINHKIIIAPFLPQVPRASTGIEQCWNGDDDDNDDDNNYEKEKPKYAEEILSHCRFDHHICHMDWPGIES
jgi:hypothetical protein